MARRRARVAGTARYFGRISLVGVLLASLLTSISSFDGTASAAPLTRSNTVEFFAGQHTGTTAANQNAKNDFSAYTFQLAESGVDVTSAYVEIAGQIGGTTSTTYASSYIYFDACVPSCSPSTTAFATTGSLGTSAGDSQYIRMRADVTSETEVAAYTGAAASRNFAVGYCFATGGTCSGSTATQLYSMTAKLVITYDYTASSTNRTSTVLYPLESAAGVGSRTTALAPCTMDSNCPLFSYNADIPEVGSQLSQQFHVRSTTDQNTSHVDYTAQVNGNASGPSSRIAGTLGSNGGSVDHRFSGLAGYSNNTSQSLELRQTGALNAYGLGGEDVVTYTHAASAPTKTKTVSYPVGEINTATRSSTKSSLTGPTVYLPETGVSIKKAWFRVRTSGRNGANSAITETMSITTKVGSNSETSATGYALNYDNGDASDSDLIHIIPSSDYAQLAAATATSGKAVQLTTQWGATNSGGATSAELMITYQYTSDSAGYLNTARVFAGQQTTSPATSWTTATGAINPSLPETAMSGVTIRGASILSNVKNTGTTAGEGSGVNLTTSTCSASLTSTDETGIYGSRLKLWRDVSGVVTTNDATTYTACFGTTQASSFSGELTITYQWYSPLVLTQSQYRWYGNANSVQPGSPLVNQNTAHGLGTRAATRLRMNIGASGGALDASSRAFKLQYGTSTSGPWTDASTWWDPAWTARKKITFDNSASVENLTNFTVRVSLSSSNVDYAKTQNAGQDIRFVDADGTTQLNHEIENWNEAATSEVWTKVPQIDASSTADYIWMYYGNAVASDGQNVTGTWDSSNRAVWHMDESSGTTNADSTSNANNATKKAASEPAPISNGIIGPAQDFDGSNDYARAADANSLDLTTTGTVSAWMKRDATGAWHALIAKGDTNSGNATNYFFDINDATNKVEFSTGSGGSSNDVVSSTVFNNTSAFYFVTGTWNGSTMIFYVNGVQDASAAQTVTPLANSALLRIGEFGGGVDYFNGVLDELRIAGIARSAAWVRAEYKTQSNTMNTFASEETYSSVAWSAFDNASPADGASITSTLLTSSNVNGAYSENGRTPLNANAVPNGSFGEWDFSLYPSGAVLDTLYYFRMVNLDGSALDAYSTYPAIQVLSNQVPNPPTNLAQTKTNGDGIPKTTLADFDSGLGTWVDSGLPGSTVSHETTIKRTGAGSARLNMVNRNDGWATDAQWGLRDLSSGGQTFTAWVYLPLATTGTNWKGRVEIYDVNSVDHGEDVTLVPGEWTLLQTRLSPEVLSNMRAIATYVWSADYNSTGTNYAYVDDVQQGSGIWTDEMSVRFTGSVSDLDASDTDQLCIEVKAVTVAFSNNEDSCGTGVAYSGTPVTANHTIASLTHATQYHWQARTKDAAGLYSAWVQYGGNNDPNGVDFGVDTSNPSNGAVRDGSSQGVDASLNSGALDTLSGNWSGFGDTGSGVARYEYSIGLTGGGTTVAGWTPVASSVTEVTRGGLTLRTGTVYYFNLRAVDYLGHTSGIVSSNGQMVAPTLTFGVSSGTIAFDKLHSGNGFTSSKTLNITTSTNAYNGYVVKQYTSSLLTAGAKTIAAYGSTWANPTTWSGTGFGYTSSDSAVAGVGDKFGGATKYAAIATGGPGDTVADHTSTVTGTPVLNQQFTLTYRVTVPPDQASGSYSSIVRLGAYASY